MGSQLATKKTEQNPSPARGSPSQPVHKAEASTVLHEEPHSSKSSEEDADLDTLLSELKLTPEGARAVDGQSLLSSCDLEGIAKRIKSGKAKRIICMCGAGLSVSAGIPDFRTPGTGLYSNLQKFNLPYPEAVFEINYFRNNPAPFFMLAKELFPGTFQPTPGHFFIKLLHDKGLLQRCFTQNIDSLEHQAGLPKREIVAAHGNFDSAHCVQCQQEHSLEHVRQAVSRGKTKCICKSCEGLVKPDIVFFGESLPPRFFQKMQTDFPQADLLIVMGTSLKVHPFASLIDKVNQDVPRVLINREKVGEADPEVAKALAYHGLKGPPGFNFAEGNSRDVFYQGDCDAGVEELCCLLGWSNDLHQLIRQSQNPKHKAHNPMTHPSM